MDEPLELSLADGTTVIARPLVPEDREALAEAYRLLSPEARYHRFWTRTGEMIGERMLDRILRQDRDNHVSWCVIDPSRNFPGLGAASWWRDAANPAQAEISATVLDTEHGRGVGTLLLALMWITAFRAGIRQLVGYSLLENRGAAEWMRACGAKGEWDGYKLVFRWDLEDLAALPETPAAARLAGWLARLSPRILG